MATPINSGVIGALTSDSWTSANPVLTPGLTNAGHWMDAVTKVTQMREDSERYVALRTFLQAVHPDVLNQFDVAYAAQKRIGVGSGSNQATNP